jgi:hypothetical protein
MDTVRARADRLRFSTVVEKGRGLSLWTGDDAAGRRQHACHRACGKREAAKQNIPDGDGVWQRSGVCRCLPTGCCEVVKVQQQPAAAQRRETEEEGSG